MSKKKVAVENYQISNNFLTTSIGRRKAIEKLSAHEGLQTFYTPFGLADSMVNGHTDGTIRVFFNLEFLEVLLNRKKDMSKVQYVGDTERKCRFAKILYKVETVLIDKENWDIILKGKKQIGEFFVGCKMNQAADVTFSNPPYNGNMDLKVIIALHEAGLLKKLICVHPSSWLVTTKTQLGEKTGDHLYRKFRSTIKDYIERIEFFNGNIVFNIGLFVPCIIDCFGFSQKRSCQIKVKEISGIQRSVQNIDEVTLHGKFWYLIKDLMQKLKVENCSQKYTSSVKVPKDGFYIQLPNIRGHVDKNTMVYEDFYTLIQKDAENNKSITNDSNRTIVFSFNSCKEQENFLNYLQTDFVRLCLSITKINPGIGLTELSFIPWLDFTQEWDDDKLFSFFGYAKGHPIREYAKTFLPDYHNLYPNGKSY